MESQLEKILGYTFISPRLLEAALTHPSLFSGNSKSKHLVYEFERLEFVGDRVLGLVIASWLFQEFPKAQEGELSKRLATLVRKDTLVQVARQMTLEKFVKVTRLNNESAEAQIQTFLADACEAVLAAIFLDGGLDAVRSVIQVFWKDKIFSLEFKTIDPKSALQEFSQKQFKVLPLYEVKSKTGFDHSPIFVVKCSVSGHFITAEGASRKLAENECAKKLLQIIKKGKG
jgi:ribonuclease-3